MSKSLLVTITLLASCEGRCMDTDRAAIDEVGAGADCVTAQRDGLCISLGKVWRCDIDGIFFNAARCAVIGTFTAESP
jgi:hypothetical protein